MTSKPPVITPIFQLLHSTGKMDCLVRNKQAYNVTVLYPNKVKATYRVRRDRMLITADCKSSARFMHTGRFYRAAIENNIIIAFQEAERFEDDFKQQEK